MDSTQNIISFCTGYGGIELGLKLAGLNVRTVAYVEIEAFACANLVAKIEQGKMDAAPIWTDLKTFDGKPFRDRVHGIIGGYPCQPFSNAGKRQGTEDPRHLFPYICEHIRTIRPVWCFFENVSGHLNLGFDEVFKSLRDMGYKVEAGLFTAAEVGAPHKRERLFILAYTGSLRGRSWMLQGKDNIRRQDIPQGELHDGIGIRSDNLRSGESGTGLAHAQSERCREAGTDSKRTPQRTTGTGAVANTDIRQSRPTVITEPTETGQPELSLYSGISGRWPARPGQPQYEWEEPRTIKPGMGRTVNGFNSRVDELRLLGNGVVPQTAALAWLTLTGEIK